MLPSLKLGPSPLCPGGPAHPSRYAIVGAHFLCREIELNNADAGHISFTSSLDKATFILPSSKTDVKALGTMRSWGCTCGGNMLIPCPLHALIDQLAYCRALASDLSLDPRAMPLFPTEDGSRPSKADAIATITHLASLLGEHTVCPSSGGTLFGGHRLRTGGAQYLAGLGVDPLRIQSMGRWKSALVIRYSGNKGSSGITADTVRGIAQSSSVQSSVQPSAAVPPPPQLALALPTAELDIAARTIHDHECNMHRMRSNTPTYILNQLSWVLHKSFDHGMLMSSRTVCGLHIMGANYKVFKFSPSSFPHTLCSKCCKEERKSVDNQDSDSTNSSDDGPTG